MSTAGIFKMPYIPEASVNHMYGLTVAKRKPKKYLKPEARNWRNLLKERVAEWKRSHGVQVCPGQPIIIDLVTHFPPRGGRGKGHKADAPNFLKLAIDGIAAGLEIDDYSVEGSWKLGQEDDEHPHLIYVVSV